MAEIDFVLPWVDGKDPDWQRRKAAYTGSELTDDREERYRDWNLMKYWFRGVEKYAPWVRKIWFICDQEPPEWLNTDHAKLEVVRHEDYLPEQYRPAFSSHPIELNIHRIKGLSEQFVYFNDDMFLLQPMAEGDFFRKSLPQDSALLNPIPTTDLKGKEGNIFTIPLNNTEYLNRRYDFRECIKTHPFKWLNIRYGRNLIRNLVLMIWPRFTGFDELHLPQAFLKSSFEKAWEADEDILDATSRHALRDDRDVNQWLIREQQLAEGLFIPRNPKIGKYLDLDRESDEAASVIREQKVKMVCLNDGKMDPQSFTEIREKIQDAFEKILPEKSAFEKEERK